MEEAWIGLWGVLIGALLSLIGSVVVPWIRDSIDRKRIQREQIQVERRDSLLAAMATLLEMNSRPVGDPERNAAQARFGKHLNELTVRVTPKEQAILDVLLTMLVMVQNSRRDGRVEAMTGETMTVLALWARGDVATDDVVPEVERRAGVKFSEDRRTVTPQ